MSGLSKAQLEALERLSSDEPKSAYRLAVRLPTLRSLVRLGYAKDVTRPGTGGMFSPTTHYQFIRIKEARHD